MVCWRHELACRPLLLSSSSSSAAVLLLLLVCLCYFSAANDIVFEVKEERDIGEVVMKLLNVIRLDNYALDKGSLTFITMSVPNTLHTGLFFVNPSNGDVTVARRIDRETICETSRHSKDCVVHFSVNVMMGTTVKDMLRIRVTIIDINDNACKFAQPEQHLELSENAEPRKTFLSLFTPSDADVDHTLKKSNFQLFPHSDAFGLRVKEQLNSASSPFLVEMEVKKPLDYERQVNYTFTLTAGDGLAEKGCALKILLTVLDENDHAPLFDKSTYTVNVSEDVAVDTVVAQLTAHDIDSGVHGQVLYELEPKYHLDHLEDFRVDARTGAVLVSRKLNYGRKKFYQLKVMGRNPTFSSHRSGQLTGHSELLIYVLDVNNHAPEMQITNINGGLELTLVEECDDYQDFGILMVKDEDADLNAKVTCHLGSQHRGNFELTSEDAGFKLTARQKFDFEEQPSVNFTVICFDQGEPRLTSQRLAIVHIVDVNDNYPTFKEKNYSYSIVEDSDPNRSIDMFFIAEMKAVDLDAGRNAEVEYSLSVKDPHVGSLIKINPNNGAIHSTGELDREDMKELVFHVIATDFGEPRRSGSTLVSLKLEDFNDNDPLWSQSEALFRIMENSRLGTEVGSLFVSDADIHENANVTFAIESTDDQLPFRLISDQQQTGKHSYAVTLLSDGPLDREQLLNYNPNRQYQQRHNNAKFATSYAFFIKAVDRGQPMRQSSVSVVVEIDDENDEAPEFHYPLPPLHAKDDGGGSGSRMSRNITEINVSYLEGVSYRLTKLKAVDRDAGENSTVSYSILSGNSAGCFDVEVSTGALFLPMELTAQHIGSYHLILLAKDNGRPRRTGSTQLLVHVVDQEPRGAGPFADGVLIVDRRTGRSSSVNLYIIIVIVIASSIISILLLTAICIVLKRSRQQTTHRRGRRELKNPVPYTLCTDGATTSLCTPGGGYYTLGGTPTPLPELCTSIVGYNDGGTLLKTTQHNPLYSTTADQSPGSFTYQPMASPTNIITIDSSFINPPFHVNNQNYEERRNSLTSGNGGDYDSGHGDSLDVGQCHSRMLTSSNNVVISSQPQLAHYPSGLTDVSVVSLSHHSTSCSPYHHPQHPQHLPHHPQHSVHLQHPTSHYQDPQQHQQHHSPSNHHPTVVTCIASSHNTFHVLPHDPLREKDSSLLFPMHGASHYSHHPNNTGLDFQGDHLPLSSFLQSAESLTDAANRKALLHSNERIDCCPLESDYRPGVNLNGKFLQNTTTIV